MKLCRERISFLTIPLSQNTMISGKYVLMLQMSKIPTLFIASFEVIVTQAKVTVIRGNSTFKREKWEAQCQSKCWREASKERLVLKRNWSVTCTTAWLCINRTYSFRNIYECNTFLKLGFDKSAITLLFCSSPSRKL